MMSGTTSTRHRLGVLGHAIGIYDELSAMENLRLFGRLYDLKDRGRGVPCSGWSEWGWSG